MIELISTRLIIFLVIFAGFVVALWKKDELLPHMLFIPALFAIGFFLSNVFSSYLLILVGLCYGYVLARVAKLELNPFRHKILAVFLVFLIIGVGFLFMRRWESLFFLMTATFIWVSVVSKGSKSKV